MNSQAAATQGVRTRHTASLIRQYDRQGPRYTSYPTAVEFSDTFGEADYRARLEAAAIAADEPVSLYVHLPFCAARCTYCGCMMIAARNYETAVRYLDHVEREISLLAAHLAERRRVIQLHWGGGTPTFLRVAEIARLHQAISSHFDILPAAEQAIELDPRVTTPEQLLLLRSLGFRRLSLGVQDFTADVQDAIGRRQSEAGTRELYDEAREIGFESINLDLIYGLPRQTLATFRKTLETVVTMRPDRVAVYSYAHVPWLRPHQKQIQAAELPGPALKLELIGAAVDAFDDAGYTSIGMDHFALPDDDLAIATRERRLHRNFMGYTTRPASDMLGVGLSAIGDVRGAFVQNARKLSGYYSALAAGRFPVARGYALRADDLVRRHVIMELMCNLRVERASVARMFGIDFDTYFAEELSALNREGGPREDGLLVMTPEALEVTPAGRLFVRTICMTFDRYLAVHTGPAAFSRTI